MTKVIIIGIDGGTFNFIRPMVEEGKLPNFKTLMEKGSYGILKSTIPPVTSPAWSTFMTGKNPGKHGVFGFIKEANNLNLVNSNSIKAEKFWNILDDYKSIIINVPLTYPPKINNGIMISGMLTVNDTNSTCPHELYNNIKKNIKDYIIEPDSSLLDKLYKKRFWSKFKNMVDKRIEIIDYLKNNNEWQILVAVFRATDIICHREWKNKSKVEEIYKKIDNYLGTLIREDINLLIVSDHGFGKVDKYFRVNQYLEEEGFLKRVKGNGDIDGWRTIRKKIDGKNNKNSIKTLLQKIGITREKAYKILPRFIIKSIIKIIPVSSLKKFIPANKARIDKEGSFCYMPTNEAYGIVFNKMDREFINSVKNKLSNLIDTETNKKIIKNIWLREELFKGNYIERAPHIIFEPERGYVPLVDYGSNFLEKVDFILGMHEPEGIFFAYGKNIDNKEIRAEILDIAPTILHIFNHPIPKDMDGRVLKEIFKPNSEPEKRQVVFQEIEKGKETLKSSLSDIKI